MHLISIPLLLLFNFSNISVFSDRFRYKTDELHGASTWVSLDHAHGGFEFESLHVLGSSHLVFEDGAEQDTPFSVNLGTVYSDKTGLYGSVIIFNNLCTVCSDKTGLYGSVIMFNLATWAPCTAIKTGVYGCVIFNLTTRAYSDKTGLYGCVIIFNNLGTLYSDKTGLYGCVIIFNNLGSVYSDRTGVYGCVIILNLTTSALYRDKTGLYGCVLTFNNIGNVYSDKTGLCGCVIIFNLTTLVLCTAIKQVLTVVS